MKRIIAFLIAWVFLLGTACAQSLPVSRMQSAISAAVQQKAIKRGFAQNDPRYGATLDLVSGGLSSVAGGTAAFVVAGAITAPAWATVAISLGVGTVVTYAVGLAVDGIVSWLFPADSSDATPITQHFTQAASTGGGLTAGGAYWVTGVLPVYASDPMSAIQTVVPLNWPDTSTSRYQVGACTDTTSPIKKTCFVNRINKSTGYNQADYSTVAATYVASGAPGTCQPGFVYRSSSCIPVPAQVPADSKVSAQAAIDALPASELNKPLNPAVVAALADKAWRDAAAKPGYAGLPYLATDPITAADVQAVREANPSRWPTVQDFVSPQPSATSPWALPSNPTATSQDPSTVSSPTTNPAASQPLINLGPDPGIGSPTLETTPTALQILQPLLNMFPDLRSLVLPTHQATCPKPSISAFGQSFVLDSHCDLAEQQRASLYSIMAAVWAIAAALIVLRA
jgi:hypothetical protein